MPGRVIRRMNLWGKRSKKERYGKKLNFLNRVKKEYDWENDELDPMEALEHAEEQRVHPEVLAEFPGIMREEDVPEGHAVADEPEQSPAQRATEVRATVGLPENPIDADEGDSDTLLDCPTGSQPAIKIETVEDYEDKSDEEELPPMASQDLRQNDKGVNDRYPSRRRKKASHMNIPHGNLKSYDQGSTQGVVHVNVGGEAAQVQIDEDISREFRPEDDLEYVLGVALVQTYSLAQGLKLFGSKAEEATTKELTQLHDMETFIPVDGNKLSYEDRKEALNSLLFITEKRDGRIKSRMCANGAPQRKYIRKEDAASPTVAHESVKITSAIDAHEKRCVKVIDIPGAFLHGELDEYVIMVFRGRLAELMAEVDPKLYRKYIILGKNGQPLLYVKLRKSIYGLLRAALIFYKKLVGDLREMEFEINPYDPCVANKMISGHQMTITFHIDDLKLSHVEERVVDNIIGELRSKYGKGIKVQDGPVVDYLGCHIHHPGDGSVQFSQIPYIQQIFNDFPEEITTTRATPAADHLFWVRDESEATFLDEERANAFHHTTAQLSFLRRGSRPDLDPFVAFLTTRVRRPDEDDWGLGKAPTRASIPSRNTAHEADDYCKQAWYRQMVD